VQSGFKTPLNASSEQFAAGMPVHISETAIKSEGRLQAEKHI